MIGKLLGIDHGLKRIGVAVSDAMGISTRELCIIERQSKEEDFALLNQLAEQENVIAFVVGIPHNEGAVERHQQAGMVRIWISRFKDSTDLPILEWDEQLSSQDAAHIAKRYGRKVTEPVDDLAARIILQSYLDALNDGLATPPPRP